LRCFVIYGDRLEELEAESKGLFLRGLFRSVIRKMAEPTGNLLQALSSAEMKIIEQLRRPTEEEMASQTMHAVTPLFAGMITA
jgi:hypothetical protein